MSVTENSISKNSISKDVEPSPELVDRAAKLLRLRPIPGSDPAWAQEWLRRVVEFLHSPEMLAVLTGLGIEPPTDFSKLNDQSPIVDRLADSLDSHEDNPALAVAVLVEVAYITLVGYAIYTHYQQAEGSE